MLALWCKTIYRGLIKVFHNYLLQKETEKNYKVNVSGSISVNLTLYEQTKIICPGKNWFSLWQLQEIANSLGAYSVIFLKSVSLHYMLAKHKGKGEKLNVCIFKICYIFFGRIKWPCLARSILQTDVDTKTSENYNVIQIGSLYIDLFFPPLVYSEP